MSGAQSVTGTRARPVGAGSRVVVIGGGISGLAAAYRLLGTGARVTVLESAHRLGGKLLTGEIAGVRVDLGAESLLARRPEALALARETGLGGRLRQPATSSAALWTRGVLRPMPKGHVMGVPAGAAALAGVLSAEGLRRVEEDRSLPRTEIGDDVAVGEYVAGRLGREVVDRLVEPLLGGVYAGDAYRISMRAAVPQLFEAARAHTSLTEGVRAIQRRAARRQGQGQAGPVFMGIEGGVGCLAQAVAEAVRARGGEIVTGAAVTGLRRVPASYGAQGGGPVACGAVNGVEGPEAHRTASGDTSGDVAGAGGTGPARWLITVGDAAVAGGTRDRRDGLGQGGGAGGRRDGRAPDQDSAPGRARGHRTTMDADAVVLALPAPAAARLLAPESPAAAAELDTVEYASMALVTLAYRRADAGLPEGSGFLVPPVDGHTIKAATFSGQKWSWVGDQDPGLLVLRTSVGRHGEEEVLQRGDAELVDVSRRDLGAATGLTAAPVASVVTRWHHGLPQYPVGHQARVTRIREHLAKLPGLVVCGAAYDGVGVPACIAGGYTAADELSGDRQHEGTDAVAGGPMHSLFGGAGE